MERQTISIMKACELLGVSRRTIYNWIAAKKVEYVRTAGGSIRIFVDTLWRQEDGQNLSLEDLKDTISIMKASIVADVSRKTIYNWIDLGILRYARTSGGSIRIIRSTLFQSADRKHKGKVVVATSSLPPPGPSTQ